MNTKKIYAAYYIKCLVCFTVMAIFCVLPPVGQITKIGMQILGIYLGTIMLWTLVDLIWPSLLAIILISFTGYDSFNSILSSGFGNQTVIFVLLISIFAYFITSSGVSTCIARFIVSLRISKGRPWIMSSLFVLASYVIGVFVSSVAATLVVLELFSQFAAQAGYKRRDKYPTLMMVCITFAAHMGGSVWTFRTPDAILVGYIQAQGMDVPLIPYFLSSVFIGGGALILYLVVSKLIFQPDISKLRGDMTCFAPQKMTRYQHRLLLCTFILLVLLVMESMLDVDTAVGSFLDKLGTNGIVMGMLVVMMFFRVEDGQKPFADIEEGTRSVPWKIIWLIIFNMPMASIMNDAELGISSSISGSMTAIFGTNPDGALFILIVTILMVIATTFIGNVPVCLMFYNVAVMFAPNLGISEPVLACIISLTSNASVILPGANPQSAMLHAHRDWVETKDIAKYAIVQSAAVIVTVLLAYTLFLRKVL